MKPFLSVIIPTLNEEKFLPKLLGDLTKQKEKDFDVLVTDGYSKDKTKDCVKSFETGLKLNFFSTKLKNVAAQRNHGAQKAEGDYLVFLDADVRIAPSFLYKVKKNINKNKGLLFLPFYMPDREYKQYKPLFDLGNLFAEFSQNLPKKFSLGGTMIVERNFFIRLGGFDERLFIAEDHEIIQRAATWGVHPKFIREAKTSFSLRRMKKEGQIKFFYKYFIASARRLFLNEEIKNRIFEYEMGGQVYDRNVKKKEEFFNHYFNQIKNLLKKMLAD
jgi:glycosyltransferase involved in cell wall biosynthesis